VTHNYERDGLYNLWFTVIAANRGRLDGILADVRYGPGVEAVHELPALHTFKIRVDFDFGPARGAHGAAPGPADDTPEMLDTAPPLPLDAADRRLIARACGDIGAAAQPYAELARETGLAEAALLERLRAYRAAGALRRFGAILRHQKAGLTANGMSVWDVPAANVLAAGRRMATVPEVSHCYERPRIPDWPYNLYAMIHARSPAACRAVAARIGRQTGIATCDLLFSRREFKKTSMVYFQSAEEQ
jgi:DNA-binding Lrp family transcriptional regulator